MPILYVANMSKQNHDFLYRVPEETKQRVQLIRIGEQIRVHKEDTLEILKAIVSQHEMYGLVAANEINRTKPFVGMCYAFDKPVDIERFMVAEEHNESVLEARGIEIRRTQAAALHNQIEQAGSSQLQNLQAETIEDTKSLDTGLNEVIEVNRDATEGKRGNRKGRR